MSTGVYVIRRDITQTFMISPVVVVFDESPCPVVGPTCPENMSKDSSGRVVGLGVSCLYLFMSLRLIKGRTTLGWTVSSFGSYNARQKRSDL